MPHTLVEIEHGPGAGRVELAVKGNAIAAFKNAGIVLISTASTVTEARSLEEAGIDAIIAQGWEAGGHRGSPILSAG